MYYDTPLRTCITTVFTRQRKFRSTSLSHLFNQGRVSAIYFAGAASEYREKIRDKLSNPFRDLLPIDRPDTA